MAPDVKETVSALFGFSPGEQVHYRDFIGTIISIVVPQNGECFAVVKGTSSNTHHCYFRELGKLETE